jgi:hypothetical protein
MIDFKKRINQLIKSISDEELKTCFDEINSYQRIGNIKLNGYITKYRRLIQEITHNIDVYSYDKIFSLLLDELFNRELIYKYIIKKSYREKEIEEISIYTNIPFEYFKQLDIYYNKCYSTDLGKLRTEIWNQGYKFCCIKEYNIINNSYKYSENLFSFKSIEKEKIKM